MTGYQLIRDRAKLLKNYHQDEKECGENFVDSSLYRLPHPVRVRLHPMGMAEYMIDLSFNDLEAQIIGPMFREAKSTQDVWSALMKAKNNEFRAFFQATTSGFDGGYGSGVTGVSFLSARYQMNRGRMFTLDDELVSMLQNTDIGADLPISTLVIPYPVVYVQLGKLRDGRSGYLKDRLTGDHVIEGAYIASVSDSIDGRIMEIGITCAPNENSSNLYDDHVEWLSIIVNETDTIEEAVKKVHSMGRLVGKDENITIPRGPESAELIKRHTATIELLLKSLLYINLPEVRKSMVDEGTQAIMKVNRAVSGAHKRKAKKAARSAYDTILILPPVSHTPGAANSDGRSVSAHWRRGHFRNQRYGEKLSLSKIVWIQPVLVNFSEETVLVSGKNYDVR